MRRSIPESNSTGAIPESEVERYLRTGDHDLQYSAWPGRDVFERAHKGHDALRQALVAEVRRRTRDAREPDALARLDVVAFTRAKVAPMVRGLFPRQEQESVLTVLLGSVVFLQPSSIERVLTETRWHGTAWELANLYLESCGAPLLADKAPHIIGLSEETTCYVSAEYFDGDESRFTDVIVHEAAHVFHNCKRRTLGLKETRRREWPLEIDYSKRETFAHACEAYSRILELGRTSAMRRDLLLELEEEPMPSDERVDPGEYVAILQEAVAARNGWRRILAQCAPRRRGPSA